MAPQEDPASVATIATGETASGSGTASDFATRNGDTAIGGNVLGGPMAACPVAPVDQFDGPERII
jgi:hypothetical protein